MRNEGVLRVSGSRSFKILPGNGNERPPSADHGILALLKAVLPFTRNREVNVYRLKNFVNIWRGLRTILLHAFLRPIGIQKPIYGAVFAKVIRGDGSLVNLGCVSLRVVTDVGVGFVVDAFQNLKESENMKFHGYGTGTTAEAASQTALTTELTTEYATDNTRPTGSTTEGASANIYRTVATLSPDGAGTLAITEHGVFDQAATGGGVLFDRSQFAAINLTRGSDSLQTTYDGTFPSGG
jgi:hypothetical protein